MILLRCITLIFFDGTRHTAAHYIAMIITSSILVPCLSVPVALRDDYRPEDTWWYNACDHHLRHVPHVDDDKAPANCPDVVPHNISNLVKRQMRSFNVFFEKELKKINKLYTKVKGVQEKHYHRDWMPNMINVAEYRKNPKTVFPVFHTGLQTYAAAIHVLRGVQVKTEISFDKSERQEVLKTISLRIKGLLCEVETAINLTCQAVPARVATNSLNIQQWAQQPDLTGMYVQDWGVLSAYKQFVNTLNKNIKRLFNAKKRNDSIKGDASLENSTILLDDDR